MIIKKKARVTGDKHVLKKDYIYVEYQQIAMGTLYPQQLQHDYKSKVLYNLFKGYNLISVNTIRGFCENRL